ncbi:Alpha-pyrone synthesis polyketide synthase-like Pks18 [Paenibacillus konkukensis]|uniref:Alpha-pyrone synthesis polyketide synthase-like Pks18 n=1 Tax=Paenibacillus konkukensis TaxID=2020716 RepID=A0ABY4RJF7_9BACL|nr:type III polyketide synthase [Paenibacillus konkukensis]UQZ82278.1 Alpha-pyrone synthesis polyketide synthase-like Pks18 [Paenibacillus konkukensis]
MEQTASKVALLGIGTSVPAYRIEQIEAAQRLTDALKDHPDSMRWAKRIFKQCAVETRYTCEPELLKPAAQCRYSPGTPEEDVPTTAERMAVYKRESVPLGIAAARQAISDAGVSPSHITHVITVSCTGQFLPGLDSLLVGALGLSLGVLRIPLNFLGCAAGLKAIGLSRRIAASSPRAAVLVVCVELCTLHLQSSVRREDLYAASFFGDGAAACVIGHSGGEGSEGEFELGEDRSALVSDYAGEMVWEVGDRGFDLYLSPGIPRIIGEWMPRNIQDWLQGEESPRLWAIHPGGKGIVDALQNSLGLTEEQTAASRAVLRDYGNLSSATILFVLQELRQRLREQEAEAADGIAIAFGPGLTAEMIRIRYTPALSARKRPLNNAYA